MGRVLVAIAVVFQLVILGGGTHTSTLKRLRSYFPPGRPSLDNLQAVCHSGEGRPRFAPGHLPSSSHSYALRAGMALNRLEDWFHVCCDQSQEHESLCCAGQAWRSALSRFCEEELAVMTAHHTCCLKDGDARWDCFAKQAPTPSYRPVEGYTAPLMPADRPFTWDPEAESC